MDTASPDYIHLSVAAAEQLCQKALRGLGYDEADAKIITDHLVEASLCGYDYSGPAKILNIAEDPRFKKPRQPVKVIRETPVSVLLDGGNNVGMLAVYRGVEAAIAKAQTSGVCIAGVANSWMSGRIAHYTEMIARAGLIGMQVESTKGTSVAPPGGVAGTLGTNPISFGFPTMQEPMVFDMGTAAIMSTDVQLRERTGQTLPEGVAIDAQGQPTRDAAAARKGAVLTFGGYKGYGLSLSVGLLGALAGASLMSERPHGGFIVAFRPDLLAAEDQFRQQASALIGKVKATPRQQGVDEIRIPSERAFRTRAQRRSTGFDIERVVYDALQKL